MSLRLIASTRLSIRMQVIPAKQEHQATHHFPPKGRKDERAGIQESLRRTNSAIFAIRDQTTALKNDPGAVKPLPRTLDVATSSLPECSGCDFDTRYQTQHRNKNWRRCCKGERLRREIVSR